MAQTVALVLPFTASAEALLQHERMRAVLGLRGTVMNIVARLVASLHAPSLQRGFMRMMMAPSFIVSDSRGNHIEGGNCV